MHDTSTSLAKEVALNGMREKVKEYYGERVQKTSDLKTDACCASDPPPDYIKAILPLINHEITERYYGCGVVIPFSIEGLKVLDVGCGTGRDCYILSRLVGEKGSVYGIDMTEGQLEIANRYVAEQTRVFGYEKPNVSFILDYIENIERHFLEGSLDLVISNCVINLAEDKEAILKQIYRVLKFGGEFYFSDIYADRRMPEELKKDPVLYGECLGGALYIRDFERLARKVGFTDPRIVSKRTVSINNKEIKRLAGDIRFYSITYRLWKLEGLEEDCEDYGHVATYLGGIKEARERFELDSFHIFCKDKPERVCGNTAFMLLKTRLSRYFRVTGDFSKHLGGFSGCLVEGSNATIEAGGLKCC